MGNRLVLGFPEYETQARRLATSLSLPFASVDIHHFPDGESKVAVPPVTPETVILVRSLNQPNTQLIELLLAAGTLRQQGSRRLILVAPYLCYMRQDMAFNPGEAISQSIIGGFLAELFDDVITVDPHLHRIDTLEQAIPANNAIALSSAPIMTAFLRHHADQPLIVGPDAESEQWVRAIAEPAGYPWLVARKERSGDREVRIRLPDADFNQRHIVLVDDMVSTGHTLITISRELIQRDADSVHCLVTHALFADDARQNMVDAGISALWSSDSVPHPSNAIQLNELLAETLNRLLT